MLPVRRTSGPETDDEHGERDGPRGKDRIADDPEPAEDFDDARLQDLRTPRVPIAAFDRCPRLHESDGQQAR